MDASRLPDLAQGDGLGPAWRLRQRAHPCPPGGDHHPGPTCGELPAIPDRLPSSGKPLLAKDPHLGVSIPGIWYQTGLHCRTVSAACPFDVAGFSFAGMPGIVVGHNQSIAWGITNLNPDVSA